MSNIPKLLSGRVPVTPYNELSNSRHEFLGLSQAEPNLGTGSNGSILTISTNNQRVFSNTITISGNTATIKNLDVTGNIIAVNITANGDANFSGNTVRLGAVSNLKITGGNTGQVLTTDGTGNLSFTTPSSSQGGNIYVFTRLNGTVYIEVQLGSITVVGRTGNTSIPVQP
jgi:hypothetical protein